MQLMLFMRKKDFCWISQRIRVGLEQAFVFRTGVHLSNLLKGHVMNH